MTTRVRCYPGIFVDVEAGAGNVLAQVALTRNVRACIGVELRRDHVSLGDRCMQQQLKQYPWLRKILLKQVNVRDGSMSRLPHICEATIVFDKIFLFEEDAKLIVLRELRAMSEARMIVATSLFCPSHRSSCTEPCCKCWELDHHIEVHVSWKATLHPLFIYRKKL
ncbi:uncharacterized protein PITG_20932 [Phytophthora infestans T30-4]|uniref:DOT1 domain-containing protein n=1 Tax=Phytophthora infestans (strain T30-4) TaxID=403677 RepID=D0P3D2_PHYIT|nr:uncharacterized protein PITG_20932 [Phytophthora infestans T30-4]EEY59480.1 conserved hypothetical protein [Phytophthora infestans T30-4]|eukprot:XP_002895186.1 conserved hypothetical protein [Phytophthora infestans T30-4]